jgi:hypothetical protein
MVAKFGFERVEIEQRGTSAKVKGDWVSRTSES